MMKKKTLLSKKNIVTVLVATLMVGLSFLAGCSSILETVKNVEEEEQLEEVREKEEARKAKINAQIEEIYLECLDGNESLEQEFNKFLEENFGDKESILECLERQKRYNDDRYNEYLQAKENLEKALNKKQISEKEFEDKKEEIWKKYLEDKNQIQDYLKEEEMQILENCEEEIQNLYESR